MVDLEAVLAAATESPPCGLNLEHDLSFFQLEEAARGKPEQRVGDAVKPGEDPNWAKVTELSRALLARSKDLRLAVYLTRSLTRVEGLPGLAAGLGVVAGLLERYWDGVHPVLEADGDATERLNALAPLSDSESLIRDVRDALIVDSREHGQLRGREIEVALGRLVPVAASVPAKALAQIHAQLGSAFATDGTVPAALREASQRLAAIQALVTDRVGAARTIEVKPLAQCLETLLEACDTALGSRATPRAAGEAADTPADLALSAPGDIRSREEALQLLDRVCRYLERHEPTNPAPLFIRRAQRLMTKSFVEIVQDLMPDSLAHLQQLAGEPEKK